MDPSPSLVLNPSSRSMSMAALNAAVLARQALHTPTSKHEDPQHGLTSLSPVPSWRNGDTPILQNQQHHQQHQQQQQQGPLALQGLLGLHGGGGASLSPFLRERGGTIASLPSLAHMQQLLGTQRYTNSLSATVPSTAGTAEALTSSASLLMQAVAPVHVAAHLSPRVECSTTSSTSGATLQSQGAISGSQHTPPPWGTPPSTLACPEGADLAAAWMLSHDPLGWSLTRDTTGTGELRSLGKGASLCSGGAPGMGILEQPGAVHLLGGGDLGDLGDLDSMGPLPWVGPAGTDVALTLASEGLSLDASDDLLSSMSARQLSALLNASDPLSPEGATGTGLTADGGTSVEQGLLMQRSFALPAQGGGHHSLADEQLDSDEGLQQKGTNSASAMWQMEQPGLAEVKPAEDAATIGASAGEGGMPPVPSQHDWGQAGAAFSAFKGLAAFGLHSSPGSNRAAEDEAPTQTSSTDRRLPRSPLARGGQQSNGAPPADISALAAKILVRQLQLPKEEFQTESRARPATSSASAQSQGERSGSAVGVPRGPSPLGDAAIDCLRDSEDANPSVSADKPSSSDRLCKSSTKSVLEKRRRERINHAFAELRTAMDTTGDMVSVLLEAATLVKKQKRLIENLQKQVYIHQVLRTGQKLS